MKKIKSLVAAGVSLVVTDKIIRTAIKYTKPPKIKVKFKVPRI